MAFLSVRNPLKGQLDDFLDRSLFSRDTKTHDGILALIEKLKLYKEEGRPLLPEIYIFKKTDAGQVKKLVPSYSELPIGESADLNSKSFEVALKKCAPLARNGWCVYMQINKSSLSFGLLRTQLPFYSLPLENILIDGFRETLPVIRVKQIAENVVQLKGLKKASLEVHFSTRSELSTTWQTHQNDFVSAILKDAPLTSKDISEVFFQTAISEAGHGHGFLAAVIKNKKKIPKNLMDGVILDEPLCIPTKLSLIKKQSTIENYTELQAALTAISGMLSSDGITLFDSSGKVLAYNIFIPLNSSKGKVIVGGARKRTYEELKVMIQKKSLVASYFQSQDGECECKRG